LLKKKFNERILRNCASCRVDMHATHELSAIPCAHVTFRHSHRALCGLTAVKEARRGESGAGGTPRVNGCAEEQQHPQLVQNATKTKILPSLCWLLQRCRGKVYAPVRICSVGLRVLPVWSGVSVFVVKNHEVRALILVVTTGPPAPCRQTPFEQDCKPSFRGRRR